MDTQLKAGLQTKGAQFANPLHYCYFDTEPCQYQVQICLHFTRPSVQILSISIIEMSALSINLCKLGSVGIKYLIIYY